MTTIISISIICVIAGLANGIMDLVSFHFEKSPKWIKENPKYWNPQISWKNKWKDGEPSNGEAFKFSSTLLVAFTDGWHLCKFIVLTSLSISIALAYSNDIKTILITFLIIRCLFGLGFKLTYR